MFEDKKKIIWVAIVFAIIITVILITIKIYSIEEENIKTVIIKNQIEIQEIITKSISKNISTEIETIIFELELLSRSNEIQTDSGTEEASKQILETYNRINSISPTAQILALDENYTVLSQVSQNHDSFIGAKVNGLSELIRLEENSGVGPKILSINTLLYDEPEIAITYPIINEQTNTTSGLLLVTFASSEFFERHGNI